MKSFRQLIKLIEDAEKGSVWYHFSRYYFTEFKRQEKEIVQGIYLNPIWLTQDSMLNPYSDFIYMCDLEPVSLFYGEMILKNPDVNVFDLETKHLSPLGMKLFQTLLPTYNNDEYETLDHMLEIVKEEWDSLGTSVTMRFIEESGFDGYYEQGEGGRNIAIFNISKIHIRKIMTTKEIIAEKYPAELVDIEYLKSLN